MAVPVQAIDQETASAAYKLIITCNCLQTNNKHTLTPALVAALYGANCESVSESNYSTSDAAARAELFRFA